MNEHSLKDKMRQIALHEKRIVNDVWKHLILERFLCRLSKSYYHDKFIFKGGLLLSYYIPMHRETRDIDLLADKIAAEVEIIKKAMTDICEIDLCDGFKMTVNSIETLDHAHMDYEGFRISISAIIGKMRDTIKIDIAIGDVVFPYDKILPLSEHKGSPLFEKIVSLKVYPIESIFSEKLETVISRGMLNTRMKDFHDLFLMINSLAQINVIQLKKSIRTTFNKRKTPYKIPIEFNADEYQVLQSFWSAHIRGLSQPALDTELPNLISEVIDQINNFLKELS